MDSKNKSKGLSVAGQVRIAVCQPGTIAAHIERPNFFERISRKYTTASFHNLETTFTLGAVAQSLAGTSSGISPTVSISPSSMAVGSGATPVTAADTVLQSELLRKYFGSAGTTKSAAGTSAIFTMPLAAGEVLGQIACVGLFGVDTGSGSVATGSITVGGSPASGDTIAISLAGRALTPVVVGAATSLSAVVAAVKSALDADGYFAPLYSTSLSGSTISITSRGKGTAYNSTVGAQVGGSTTISTTPITGGTTPGGQLIAAANTSLQKVVGKEVVVEWTIKISN